MQDSPANHDGAMRLSSILLGIAGSALIHTAAIAVLFVTLGGPTDPATPARTLIARGQPILVRLVESEIEEDLPLPEPEANEQPIETELPEIPVPSEAAQVEGDTNPVRLATNWCAEAMEKFADSTTRAMNRTIDRAVAIEQVLSTIVEQIPDAPSPAITLQTSAPIGPPVPPPVREQVQPESTALPMQSEPPSSTTRSPSRSTPKPVGVTNGAEVVSVPEPLYPSRSIRLGQEGTVEVEVVVLPDGTVDDVRVVRSSGHRLLDRAALEAAKRGRYLAAKENGRAIRATILVPFEFHLH